MHRYRPGAGLARAVAHRIALLAGTALIAVGLALPLTPTGSGHCYAATADPVLPGCPSTLTCFTYGHKHYANNTVNPGDFLQPLAVALAVLLVSFVAGNAAMLGFCAGPWISAVGRAHTMIGVVLLLAICLVESPSLMLFAELPRLGFSVLFAGLTLLLIGGHRLTDGR